MGIWILTATIGAAWAQDPCPNRAAILVELELAVQEGRFDDADGERQRLIEALACGPAAEVDVLARLWLAEAVILSAFGDEGGADDALKAAGRVAPTLWLDVYGPEFQARWFAAQAEEIVPGRLRLQPVPEGHITLVDGSEVHLPGLVPSGLHVAQVGPDADNITFAQEIFLLPDQDLVVRTGLVGRSETGGSTERDGFPVFLAIGGATAVGAATTAALAFRYNGQMRDAPDQEALDAAYRTQRVLGTTSYTLMGLTAVTVGLHIAI